MRTKRQKICDRIGLALICLGSLALILSASTKFAQVPKIVAQLNAFGFQGKISFLAILELVCALLFLIPQTRSVGLVMVSAYLGGAIATHIQHGQPPTAPAIILAVIWIGTVIRHPQSLWSFFVPSREPEVKSTELDIQVHNAPHPS
jgi:DoxX-like family